MWTTLCANQSVGLDFNSGSGFCQWVWICQWAWIWKPHGPDSLLYQVIYTQPWHKTLDKPIALYLLIMVPFCTFLQTILCCFRREEVQVWSVYKVIPSESSPYISHVNAHRRKETTVSVLWKPVCSSFRPQTTSISAHQGADILLYTPQLWQGVL